MNIAAIQLEINNNEDRLIRVEKVNGILKDIEKGEKKPDLIILPEIWGCGFFAFDRYRKNGEDILGDTYSFLKEWAMRLDCNILCGSFIEKKDDSYFNTSLFLNRKGEVCGKYRKIHLFGYESEEQKILTPGNEVAVINTEFGRIGLSTCYDLRFPEQYRKMVDHGAEILLVVSAWPIARLNHWRLFNQVRALENQSFLISCNCSGIQCGIEFAGYSMVVSPAGEVLFEADEKPCVLWSSIDLFDVKKQRSSFPALNDRVRI